MNKTSYKNYLKVISENQVLTTQISIIVDIIRKIPRGIWKLIIFFHAECLALKNQPWRKS